MTANIQGHAPTYTVGMFTAQTACLCGWEGSAVETMADARDQWDVHVRQDVLELDARAMMD